MMNREKHHMSTTEQTRDWWNLQSFSTLHVFCQLRRLSLNLCTRTRYTVKWLTTCYTAWQQIQVLKLGVSTSSTHFHICSLGGWYDRRPWAWRMRSWSCSGDTFPAAFGCTGTLDSPSSPPCSMRHCGLRWDEEGKRLALLHSREPMHSSYTARSPPLRMPTPAARRCPLLQIACCTPWLPRTQCRHKKRSKDISRLGEFDGYTCVLMKVEIMHVTYIMPAHLLMGF